MHDSDFSTIFCYITARARHQVQPLSLKQIVKLLYAGAFLSSSQNLAYSIWLGKQNQIYSTDILLNVFDE